MPAILALGKKRQEDLKFIGNLHFKVRPKAHTYHKRKERAWRWLG